ncbi:MAG: DUF1573 domain-containing protein, partial [Planctomycetes bacterium]|nr:DUF1573 domain-containing protein [Planctomycetota bacterium]
MNGTNRIAGTMSLALGVFVTMASSCGQEAAPAAEVPRPNIVLEPSALDFGKLYEPDSYTQQVTIRNTGDAELVLRTLASTCGCTVPRIGDAQLVQTKGTAIDVRIAPGESVIMDVTLNSFGKLDKVEQKVTITSNDPDTPTAIVEVTAFVEPIVRITPWPLNFGDVQKGATVTRTIAVTTKNESARCANPARSAGWMKGSSPYDSTAHNPSWSWSQSQRAFLKISVTSRRGFSSANTNALRMLSLLRRTS